MGDGGVSDGRLGVGVGDGGVGVWMMMVWAMSV